MVVQCSINWMHCEWNYCRVFYVRNSFSRVSPYSYAVLLIDTGFCKIVVAKVIRLTTELWTLNPLLEVSELSGFKRCNAHDDYFSYSEKESTSLLEALSGSSLHEPSSPIVNTLPMGSLVVSPAIKLESSVDTSISRSPTVTCSGCWLFSPLALPPRDRWDITVTRWNH